MQQLSQKKDVSPVIVKHSKKKLKCESFLCRSIVFCQTINKCPSCCHKSTCRGQTRKLLEAWKNLGAGPKVVQILKEGYTPHFWIQTKLARATTIISCYVNPHRNVYLLEALHQLTKMQWSWSKSKNLWAFTTGYFWSQNQATNLKQKNLKWRHQK